MSKQTFDAAMAAAGFNDSVTKISKSTLKTIMSEIADGIWGGATGLSYVAGSFDSERISAFSSVMFQLTEVVYDPTIMTLSCFVYASGISTPICVQFNPFGEYFNDLRKCEIFNGIVGGQTGLPVQVICTIFKEDQIIQVIEFKFMPQIPQASLINLTLLKYTAAR